MNDQSRETLDEYYAEAASWNRDRVLSSRRSQRIAWIVAIAAASIAVLEAIALVLLMPLKTLVPFTLMVDRTTGYVQAIKPQEQSRTTPDSALTQSFLAQYVIARESFDRATVNIYYRKAAMLSSGRARAQYLQQIQSTNPDSPLVRYPAGTIVDVTVKSISQLAKNTALVRFDTSTSVRNGQGATVMPWVAVIKYRYSNEPMSLEDRLVNPLGFQVTEYRKNAEGPSAVDRVDNARDILPNAQQPYTTAQTGQAL